MNETAMLPTIDWLVGWICFSWWTDIVIVLICIIIWALTSPDGNEWNNITPSTAQEWLQRQCLLLLDKRTSTTRLTTPCKEDEHSQTDNNPDPPSLAWTLAFLLATNEQWPWPPLTGPISSGPSWPGTRLGKEWSDSKEERCRHCPTEHNNTCLCYKLSAALVNLPPGTGSMLCPTLLRLRVPLGSDIWQCDSKVANISLLHWALWEPHSNL